MSFTASFAARRAISPGKLQAYLGAAARNRAKDFLRKQAPVEADLDTVTLPDGANATGTGTAAPRAAGARRAAIEAMSPVDREIFLRYYYCLQPAPEIAQAMGLTHGAVRTRLSRGRAALKKLYYRRMPYGRKITDLLDDFEDGWLPLPARKAPHTRRPSGS